MFHSYCHKVAVLFGALAFLSSTAALAKDYIMDGWYVSGAGGLAITTDSDFQITENNNIGEGDYDFDNGYVLVGSFGRDFGDFRFEVEGSYRKNALDSLNLTSVTVAGTTFLGNVSADLDGDHTSMGLMLNGIYDIDIGSKFIPFVLAGVGASMQTLDVDSVAGISTDFDDTSTVFAYQFGAGISYPLAKNANITGQYRYFGSEDPDFEDVQEIEGEYDSHTLMIGLTLSY